MDFGDSMLQKMKDERDGKFLSDKQPESKILKKHDENKFLDESVDPLQSLLLKIPLHVSSKHKLNSKSDAAFKEMFEILKSMNSFEIDHFIKRETMFDVENCHRLLVFFSRIMKSGSTDFDFKAILLKVYLEAAAEKLINSSNDSQLGSEGTKRLLTGVKDLLGTCQRKYNSQFLEVTTILERLSNSSNVSNVL